MAADIKVTVTDRGVMLAVRAMTQILQDATPVMKAIGRTLESNVNVRFDTKTAPDGQPWAPWAPSTAAARAREGRGTLLEYTGRMRDSLTYVADAHSVEVGFGVPYAKYHEPYRPLLLDNGNLSNDDLNDALDAALKAFRKQLRMEAR